MSGQELATTDNGTKQADRAVGVWETPIVTFGRKGRPTLLLTSTFSRQQVATTDDDTEQAEGATGAWQPPNPMAVWAVATRHTSQLRGHSRGSLGSSLGFVLALDLVL